LKNRERTEDIRVEQGVTGMPISKIIKKNIKNRWRIWKERLKTERLKIQETSDVNGAALILVT
jgi:hypothetical protein